MEFTPNEYLPHKAAVDPSLGQEIRIDIESAPDYGEDEDEQRLTASQEVPSATADTPELTAESVEFEESSETQRTLERPEVQAYYEVCARRAQLPLAAVPYVLDGERRVIYGPEQEPLSVARPSPEAVAAAAERYSAVLEAAGRFVVSVLQHDHPDASHSTPNLYARHNREHPISVASGLLVPKRVVSGTLTDINIRAVTRDEAMGPGLRKVLAPNPGLISEERFASQAYFLLWGRVAPAPRMDRMTAAVCMVAADVDIRNGRPIVWPRYIGKLLSQPETTEKYERGLFD